MKQVYEELMVLYVFVWVIYSGIMYAILKSVLSAVLVGAGIALAIMIAFILIKKPLNQEKLT